MLNPINKMNHEEYMKLAIVLAEENVNTNTGGPFGAVVVKDGRVIGASANLVTSTNDPTAHAEVSAIREACKNIGSFDLSGSVIYASCEPCPMCLGAIYWARIAKVYYAADRHNAADSGFDDALIYHELDLPAEQRQLPTEQIMSSAGAVPFALWKASGKKIEY